jgi:hypothetical protein
MKTATVRDLRNEFNRISRHAHIHYFKPVQPKS